MKLDSQGLAVTTTTDSAIDVVNLFIHELIRNGKHTGIITDGAKHHPDCFLIQCFAAGLNLFFQEPENYAKAKQYLARIKDIKDINPREKLYYHALMAWSALDYNKAIECLVEITKQWPQDVAAAKFAEWLFYCTGQKHQGKRFKAMCEPMYQYNKRNPYFLASYAFSLELSGEYDKAKQIATDALEIDQDTVWAHHAISHVQLLRGEIDKSITFLEYHKASWQEAAPPLCTHNYWHLSLLYLANQDFDKAINIFNHHIWTDYPDTIWQLIEGTSFLWRAEMAGRTQDMPWNKIAAHIGRHLFYHDVPFNNMHLFYALTRNRQADLAREAIKKLRTDIKSLPISTHHAWHDIAIPLFEGVVSFAENDYENASNHFSAAMKDIYVIGGSDAQCEIAIQAYYLSLLKSGKKIKADGIYQKYLSNYNGTQLAAYWHSL